MRAGLFLILGLILATPALGAPERRTPDQQQALIDLAYALGEVHALHMVCAEGDDPTWRTRMSRMIEVEAPEDGFRRKLVSSFNAGFASRQAEYPTCRPEAEAVRREAARRGETLARQLSARAP